MTAKNFCDICGTEMKENRVDFKIGEKEMYIELHQKQSYPAMSDYTRMHICVSCLIIKLTEVEND